MKKLSLILSLLLLFSFSGKSSHVFGGDMHFEQIGTNQFRLFFRLAHDTLGFGSTSSVLIYENSTNSFIKTKILNKDSTRKWILKNGSIKIDSIYVSYFSDTVFLANNTNGYYTSWSHCCRINPLVNIASQSYTMTCKIPNPGIIGGNSNPEFVRYPDSLYMCVGQTKILDFSCTDPDGDSLVYSLVAPYNTPSSSGRKPFTLSNWNIGFGVANYLGPGANCTINSSTGIVITRSVQLGFYQVAVLCEEYRNGVKIGETYRDIPVPAINCSILSTDRLESISSIKIFPNPSNGNFMISIEDYKNKNYSLNITDVTGKTVHKEQINSSQTSINLESLNKGIYFVQLSDGAHQTTKRIVIQ